MRKILAAFPVALVLGACTNVDSTWCDVVVPKAASPAPAQVYGKANEAMAAFARANGYECKKTLDGAGVGCIRYLADADLGMTTRSSDLEYWPSTREDDKDVERMTIRVSVQYLTVAPWKSSGADFEALNTKFTGAVQAAVAPQKADCRVNRRPD